MTLHRNRELHDAIVKKDARIAWLETELQRARDEAIHDDLTSLFNRKGLRLAAATEAKQQRIAFPTGVALLDINRFKPINETYTHVAGDVALCDLARALETVLDCDHEFSIVARLGGDEFAAIAPMDHLARLKDLTVVTVNDIEVTVSAGVTPWLRYEHLSILLARAAAAERRAKRDNREFERQTGKVVSTLVDYDPRVDDHTVPVPDERPLVRDRDIELPDVVFDQDIERKAVSA